MTTITQAKGVQGTTKQANKANKATKANETTKATAPKVTYLKAGVTGKQLMTAKVDTNRAHKLDAGSFSYCLKRAIDFDKGFIASIKVAKGDLTPSKLLPYMTTKEVAIVATRKDANKPQFSVWLVMSLINRMAKAK